MQEKKVMKLTLVLLAAGMGSRYGGLKQLDRIGPSGETMLDYAVFDAARAGFERVVFVIRRDFEEEFKRNVGSRYENILQVDYAFQSLDFLPGNFKVPEGRVKPWGTGHALYSAAGMLDSPFAVVNADDFYGRDSFVKLAGKLREFAGSPAEKGVIRGVICAFPLKKTLSENGSVSRGVCSIRDGLLTGVIEHTEIFRENGRIVSVAGDGGKQELPEDQLVSMNCWGFMPEFAGELEELFTGFLREHGNELKSEFYLPFVVDHLIHRGRAAVSAVASSSPWFGITYHEDRDYVASALKKLTEEGEYPADFINGFKRG